MAVGAAFLAIVALLLPKSIELKRIREPKKLESAVQQTGNEKVPVAIESEESTDSQDSERTQKS